MLPCSWLRICKIPESRPDKALKACHAFIVITTLKNPLIIILVPKIIEKPILPLIIHSALFSNYSFHIIQIHSCWNISKNAIIQSLQQRQQCCHRPEKWALILRGAFWNVSIDASTFHSVKSRWTLDFGAENYRKCCFQNSVGLTTFFPKRNESAPFLYDDGRSATHFDP